MFVGDSMWEESADIKSAHALDAHQRRSAGIAHGRFMFPAVEVFQALLQAPLNVSGQDLHTRLRIAFWHGSKHVAVLGSNICKHGGL